MLQGSADTRAGLNRLGSGLIDQVNKAFFRREKASGGSSMAVMTGQWGGYFARP